jgi:hypothetical protein
MHEGRDNLGGLRLDWRIILKWILREIQCDGVDLFIQWRPDVNMAMNNCVL